MAIAEEAEKGSYGEGGRGRGASAGSWREADTSPKGKKKKIKEMKSLGQRIDSWDREVCLCGSQQ